MLNVNANQIEGTKDVEIKFDLTSRSDAGELNLETWFRTDPNQSQWERAYTLTLPVNEEWDVEANEYIIYSHRIAPGSDIAENRSFVWQAGDDAPDIKTEQAQVRVIVFYTKEGLDGAASTAKDQVSGWDGFDDQGTDGGDYTGTDGGDYNGTDGGDYTGTDGGDYNGTDGGDYTGTDGGDYTGTDGGDPSTTDSDGDGVMDAYDYAPNDPAIWNDPGV